MVAFFLEHLAYEKRCSGHTQQAYRHDLAQFQEFLASRGQEDITQATKRDVRSWIVALNQEGFKSVSINRKLSSLRTFFQFLLRQGKVSANPLKHIHALKKAKHLPHIFQEKNILQLFDVVDFSPEFSGLRDRLVLELLYGTGMRLSELLGLRWNQINIPQSEIRIFGKRQKERLVPIYPKLKQLITQYKLLIETQIPNQLNHQVVILTDSFNPAYPVLISRIVKKYLSVVSTEKKKSPHVLRHTFASHMLNSGAEINSIKELLGHSSLAATQVYTHTSVSKLLEAYDFAHPRARHSE